MEDTIEQKACQQHLDAVAAAEVDLLAAIAVYSKQVEALIEYQIVNPPEPLPPLTPIQAILRQGSFKPPAAVLETAIIMIGLQVGIIKWHLHRR